MDFWIPGSFAFTVMLFDATAESENEPKSDQKSRFRISFYSVLKGSACRWGGDHVFIHLLKIFCMYMYIYIYGTFE